MESFKNGMTCIHVFRVGVGQWVRWRWKPMAKYQLNWGVVNEIYIVEISSQFLLGKARYLRLKKKNKGILIAIFLHVKDNVPREV